MAFRLPYTFRTAGQRTPLNRLDQNFAALADWINWRVSAVGPIASRPVAGHAGAVYVASDEGYAWYLDDGATWHAVGGMGTGALTIDPDTENLALWGAGGGTDGRRVVTGHLGTPSPTPLPGVVQLYVADVLGVNGRATWTTRDAAGPRPVDPMLARTVGATDGFTTLTGTGESALDSWMLPAGTLTGRSAEVYCRFAVTNTSGVARILTCRAKLGPAGTALATAAFTFPIGVTDVQAAWVCQIDALDGTTQRAAHTYTPSYPAASTTNLSTVDGALDLATPLALAVTAQWNAANATLTAYTLTVRLL